MNRGVRYVLVGAFTLGLTLDSYGTIVITWGAESSTTFNLANSTWLPVGDLIEVGTFSNTNGITQFSSAAGNLVNFAAFATGYIGDGGLPDGFAYESDSASDTGFAHQQIYLVAVNAPTIAAATEQGIWTVDFTINSSWRFPASTDSQNSTLIDLEDLNSYLGALPNSTVNAPLADGAHIVLGTPGITGGTDGNSGFALAVLIPEPSTDALVATGILGMIGLIRHRRS
jgi:hypothetical protein